MRVLVVHNRYSSRVPSGENLAVDDEVRWLREAGVDVHTHEVSNDDVLGARQSDQLRQAVASVWSFSAQRNVTAVLDRVQPDVVHVHNLFPLLSASVLWRAIGRTPVVWTVHNHRVLCVAGTNFRNGAPCHLCHPGWRLPGIRYSCYSRSEIGSAVITVASSIFRGIAKRRVTALAISNNVRDWLVGSAGFPAERVRVKHNGVDGPPSDDVPPAAGRRVFLFAGHVTDYKGIPLLLDAWERAQLPDDVELRIEPFGRSAAEALAYSRPVITTGSGGLSEIVDDHCGWITGRSPEVLARALEAAANDDAAIVQRAEAGRRRYADCFSPEATTAELVRIYENEMKR